jgi:hypothetical protein
MLLIDINKYRCDIALASAGIHKREVRKKELHMTKRSLLLGIALVFIVAFFAAPSAHAQLVGGDPNNNSVCPADLDLTGCQDAGFGGTSSGGTAHGSTNCCRGTWGNPSTYCFSPTWNRPGQLQATCTRGLVSTGYCLCTNGNMTGSCSMFAR